MARPTKFTEETIERLCEALVVGASLEGAARYAGISYNTLNNWRQGRGFPAGTKAEEKQEFLDRLTRAESAVELDYLVGIQKAAKDDWRAAAWWLERRRPKEYGKRAIEVTGANGGPIEIRALAERIAATDGLNVDEVIAEAEELIARGGAA